MMADAQIAPVPVSRVHRPEREKHRVSRSQKASRGMGLVQNLDKFTLKAHRGIAKPEAAKLIGKIAAVSSLPLGKVRAELIPDSTWKRAGRTLGPQASQTTARLSRVFEFAQRIWGNERDAAEWLSAPHMELDGVTPYSMLRTEAGGRVVEALLGAIEYGFPV
jgi:putative toxin-antitoxin system antitoxin component (TIGR02293 family)